MSTKISLLNMGEIFRLPPHKEVRVPKQPRMLLRAEGFRPAVGDPVGQIADYRKTTPDGRSIHVREYDHSYGIHWDRIDPTIDAVEHLRRDAPGWFVVLTSSVGASIGSGIGYLGGGKRGASFGLVLGLLGGLIVGCLAADWS